MNLLFYWSIFCCFIYGISTPVNLFKKSKTFLHKKFSPGNDLKLKLVDNNQKVITKKYLCFS